MSTIQEADEHLRQAGFCTEVTQKGAEESLNGGEGTARRGKVRVFTGKTFTIYKLVADSKVGRDTVQWFTAVSRPWDGDSSHMTVHSEPLESAKWILLKMREPDPRTIAQDNG